MMENENILAFLLYLNSELAEKEAKAEAMTPPGLPADWFNGRAGCLAGPARPGVGLRTEPQPSAYRKSQRGGPWREWAGVRGKEPKPCRAIDKLLN